MKLRVPLAIAAITLTGSIVGLTSSASAADTATTFGLTGGSLAMTVQPTAALTGAATGVEGMVISGTLGAVSVTDARGGTTLWNVSAASSVFTGTNLSTSTAVNYTAGVVAETGIIVVADGAVTTLTEVPAPVVSPTSLSGNNAASWNPTLAITMPAGALAGAYSGTVTTSIL